MFRALGRWVDRRIGSWVVTRLPPPVRPSTYLPSYPSSYLPIDALRPHQRQQRARLLVLVADPIGRAQVLLARGALDAMAARQRNQKLRALVFVLQQPRPLEHRGKR